MYDGKMTGNHDTTTKFSLSIIASDEIWHPTVKLIYMIAIEPHLPDRNNKQPYNIQ